MKRFLATTALVMTTSAAAFAMSNEQLKDSVENELNSYEMEVNVDALTDDQISAIYVIMTTGDSPLDKQQRIESILEDANSAAVVDEKGMVITLPANDMRAQVQSRLAIMGFDVDVSELDDETIQGIYLVATSGENPNDKNAKIEAMLQ
ncbi:hypothetical protein [Parasulfitobacter algicola]|uniref:Uncharacterized protein n=1 Tax=Parasulfitobacter algicola TaxID=2614809 RepID=A0ABX2IUH3_9RHOB|nr:hypothetical protein [Sulfitobacter algicola]NSX54715.1 hypothetical protein [Sulfitobacter algicola]